MPGAKLPTLTITNKQYFRDDGMYIDGTTDGTLNITSDSVITLDGNVTIPGAKYIEFSEGEESLRFPNDGVIASGMWDNSGATMWGTSLASGTVCGWLRVKVASGSSSWSTMYTPLFSGATGTGM